MQSLRTSRLHLHAPSIQQARFIYALLNSPTWLRYIGDRGVRSTLDAQRYIRRRLLGEYQQGELGLYQVDRRDGIPIGLCGLIQRKFLPHPDLGFALLPAYEGQGYAHESAVAVLAHAFEDLDLPQVLAITIEDNPRSQVLLQRLGFERQPGILREPGHHPMVVFRLLRHEFAQLTAQNRCQGSKS